MVRSSKIPAGVHKTQPGQAVSAPVTESRASVDGPGELVVSGMADGNEGDGDSPRMIARGAPAGEAGPHGGSLTGGLAREPPSEAMTNNGAGVMS